MSCTQRDAIRAGSPAACCKGAFFLPAMGEPVRPILRVLSIIRHAVVVMDSCVC